ncbi:MAG: hypothetical protein FJ118_04000 [Deltaproteobacteria bacterium]|nr:hypothetical protein [Deltaproteobacteria bacterium]
MLKTTPKPSFIISAELHDKIAKSGARVVDGLGEVVRVRTRAGCAAIQPHAETRYSLRELQPRKGLGLAELRRAIAVF